MLEGFADWGFALAICVWIITKLWNALMSKKGDYIGPERRLDGACVVSPDMKASIYEMERQIKDIHHWLGKEDPSSGRKLIYMTQAMDESLRALPRALDELSDAIERSS